MKTAANIEKNTDLASINLCFFTKNGMVVDRNPIGYYAYIPTSGKWWQIGGNKKPFATTLKHCVYDSYMNLVAEWQMKTKNKYIKKVCRAAIYQGHSNKWHLGRKHHQQSCVFKSHVYS